jgi:hypothetical protein
MALVWRAAARSCGFKAILDRIPCTMAAIGFTQLFPPAPSMRTAAFGFLTCLSSRARRTVYLAPVQMGTGFIFETWMRLQQALLLYPLNPAFFRGAIALDADGSVH